MIYRTDNPLDQAIANHVKSLPAHCRQHWERLDRIVPWERLEAKLRPHYYQSGKRGQQPYPLKVMLRIHCAQLSKNWSDRGAEKNLLENMVVRCFVGLSFTDSTPDETTILRFRRFLEEESKTDALFNEINLYLSEKGFFIGTGTIVDATFIDAPSSTKNKSKSRDPEMASGKKGNTWHLGMKAHQGCDDVDGLVHTVKFTAANVHDIVMTDQLRRPTDKAVYGDAGYLGADKRESADPNVEYAMAARYSQRKKMSPERVECEKKLSGKRSKVEWPFHRVKVQFGYCKTRYKGIFKNACRIVMLFGLANLFMADCYEKRNRKVTEAIMGMPVAA